MKRETVHEINRIVWFIITAILMGTVYTKWSAHGVYTLGSFLVSLLIHGCPCLLFCLAVGEWIDSFYDKRDKQ